MFHSACLSRFKRKRRQHHTHPEPTERYYYVRMVANFPMEHQTDCERAKIEREAYMVPTDAAWVLQLNSRFTKSSYNIIWK